MVKPSQISHSARKRKRATVTYDIAGIPVPSVAQEAEEIINTDRFIQVIYLFMSMPSRCFLIDNILNTEQVRLDVPRNFTPVHGKIYVSMHVRQEISRCTEDIRSIYVNPEDLVIPVGNQAEKAHQCFYV